TAPPRKWGKGGENAGLNLVRTGPRPFESETRTVPLACSVLFRQQSVGGFRGDAPSFSDWGPPGRPPSPGTLEGARKLRDSLAVWARSGAPWGGERSGSARTRCSHVENEVPGPAEQRCGRSETGSSDNAQFFLLGRLMR